VRHGKPEGREGESVLRAERTPFGGSSLLPFTPLWRGRKPSIRHTSPVYHPISENQRLHNPMNVSLYSLWT
jgi:hypothetical protein